MGHGWLGREDGFLRRGILKCRCTDESSPLFLDLASGTHMPLRPFLLVVNDAKPRTRKSLLLFLYATVIHRA